MLSIFRRLMKNEKGATAIEYTLIASLIAVAAIAAMTTVGGKITNTLNIVSNRRAAPDFDDFSVEAWAVPQGAAHFFCAARWLPGFLRRS